MYLCVTSRYGGSCQTPGPEKAVVLVIFVCIFIFFEEDFMFDWIWKIKDMIYILFFLFPVFLYLLFYFNLVVRRCIGRFCLVLGEVQV